jgi:UDP:flavonoid glycosyltransferase YjiC (YdhE family)
VREAVSSILSDDDYRVNAARLQRALIPYSGVDLAVELVTDLAVF